MNFLSSGTEKSSEQSIKLGGTDTPQTQMTNDTEISVSYSPKEYNQFLPNTILLQHFTKIFLHLRRAVVRYTFFKTFYLLLSIALQYLLLSTFKKPTLQKLHKNFSGEKAMISHLPQNIQVQCMKCQTRHLS